MKSLKKISVFCLIVTMLLNIVCLNASASEIVPRYDNISLISCSLDFSGTAAYCSLNIDGKNGADHILGNFVLYDVTAGKAIRTWTIDFYDDGFNTTRTVSVTKGHKYRVYFEGYVHSSNTNLNEYVTASTLTKTC